MTLKEELSKYVTGIFSENWTERSGQVVPETNNLKLSNDAVKLNAVVLYADMSESTKLVDSKKAFFAAEIYKSFLYCTAKIIRSESGVITSFDGDRIMAVFIGASKYNSAARASLKINHAQIKIINPALYNQYPKSNYQIKHTVAIDNSKLFVTRTGIRGSNDLIWVGKSANHAAKMGSLPNSYPSRMSSEVYNQLDKSLKLYNGQNIWEKVTWNTMNRTIYRSNWHWKIS